MAGSSRMEAAERMAGMPNPITFIQTLQKVEVRLGCNCVPFPPGTELREKLQTL